MCGYVDVDVDVKDERHNETNSQIVQYGWIYQHIYICIYIYIYITWGLSVLFLLRGDTMLQKSVCIKVLGNMKRICKSMFPLLNGGWWLVVGGSWFVKRERKRKRGRKKKKKNKKKTKRMENGALISMHIFRHAFGEEETAIFLSTPY